LRFYNWVPDTVVVTQHFSVGVMSETPMPYGGFELRILPAAVEINSTAGVFQGPVEVYVDDVVVARSRSPCD
jgi:hypothetical protein